MKRSSRPRRILLVHQNFPGQFKHLVKALLCDTRNEVTAFTMNPFDPQKGLRVIRYQVDRGTSTTVHPWVAETETKVIRGDAAFRAAQMLSLEGYVPDLIKAGLAGVTPYHLLRIPLRSGGDRCWV